MKNTESILPHVSSAELVRNFAEVRERTARGPVVVKNHGRETHVLLSIAQYESLSAAPVDAATGGNALTELGPWLTDAIIQCSRDLQILQVNRVAEALLRRSSEELVGAPLASLRELTDSHLLAIIQRTNQTNEPETVDIASPFARNSWLRFRCLPWRDRNVLLFRDITETVENQRLAETKAAIIDAMNLHGGIGYARVSLRGLIDRMDVPFAAMLGLPEERLLGTPIINLITRDDRTAVRDAIEHAIDDGSSHRLDVSFMANGGTLARSIMAVVPINGSRGISGAVALITRIV